MSTQVPGNGPDEATPDALADLRKEVLHLRDDNERLKNLVITLAAATIKNVYGVHPHIRAEHVLTTAEACYIVARLPDIRPKLAEALETLGDELSARAVAIDCAAPQRSEGTREGTEGVS